VVKLNNRRCNSTVGVLVCVCVKWSSRKCSSVSHLF